MVVYAAVAARVRCRLKVCSDGSDVIAGGSMFQTPAVATGKAQSPMVLFIYKHLNFYCVVILLAMRFCELWEYKDD